MKCRFCGEEINVFDSHLHNCPEKLKSQRFWAKVFHWGLIVFVFGITLEAYLNYVADAHSTSFFGFLWSEIYRFALFGIVLVGSAAVGWGAILVVWALWLLLRRFFSK
jgi:cytochrome b561